MDAPRTLITRLGAPLWIVRPLRERGRKIPRHTWQAGEERALVGRLKVAWTVSEKHRRQMHVARFQVDSRDALPLIRDVHLVQLAGADLTITGFEEIEDREYAQTWFCRIAVEGWQGRGKPDEPVGRI